MVSLLQLRSVAQTAPTAKVTLGCPVIDALLHGGFACGTITELVGEAGSAKTQIVLQSLLTAQLPATEGGLDGCAAYLYTEGGIAVERLSQIYKTRFHSKPSVALENVLLEHMIHTSEGLMRAVEKLEVELRRRQLASERQIRLIAIDSVANVFRDLGDKPGVEQFKARADSLFQLAGTLKRLANTYDLAVVVTNQVADDFNFQDAGLAVPSEPNHKHLITSGRSVLPAMGLAWMHCVNTRLFTARHDHSESITVRSLQVNFSPHLPPSYCYFTVQQTGVHGLESATA